MIEILAALGLCFIMIVFCKIVGEFLLWRKRRKYTDKWFDIKVNDYGYMHRQEIIDRIIRDVEDIR